MTERFYLCSRQDGLELGIILSVPDEGDVRGIVQFAHGMCGKKEKFLPSMEYLSSQGFACIINDHRGHGESIRSENDRGYMYKAGYRALVDDMKTVSDFAMERYPGKPLFLVGHSMGSLAARIYARQYGKGLAGIFLCGSPARNPLSGIARIFSAMLCALGCGHFRPYAIQKATSWKYNRRFRNEGFQAWTCSDPKVREAAAADPACNFTFTANGAFNLMSMMKCAYSRERVTNPGLPVFLMNGEDDPCSKGAEGLAYAAGEASKVGYINVRTFLYHGMRHEILSEPASGAVLGDMLSQMDKIISAGHGVSAISFLS